LKVQLNTIIINHQNHAYYYIINSNNTNVFYKIKYKIIIFQHIQYHSLFVNIEEKKQSIIFVTEHYFPSL
jgi:hypothetical protein